MTEEEWKTKLLDEFGKLSEEEQKSAVLELLQQYGAEAISHARQIKHLLTVIETVVKACKNSDVSESRIAEAIDLLDKSVDCLIYCAKEKKSSTTYFLRLYQKEATSKFDITGGQEL